MTPAVRKWLLGKAREELEEARRNVKSAVYSKAGDIENVARKRMYTYEGKTENLYASNLRDGTRWLKRARAELAALQRVVKELSGGGK